MIGNKLYVGASGYRRNYTDKTQGRIYGYEFHKEQRLPKLKFTLTCDLEYAQFGNSMVQTYFDNQDQAVLAVSSPSEVIRDYLSKRCLDRLPKTLEVWRRY
jgi:hypothetical protein